MLDGECKGTHQEHEKAILVFHSLDQLACKDEALALLTTNNSFTFYNSWVVDGAGYVQTYYHELRKFKLGPIADINIDVEKDSEFLQLPPSFPMGEDGFEETDRNTLTIWKSLWSEVRGFIGILLYAVDIITDSVSALDLKKVAAIRQASYNAGWGEPNFTATDNSDLKSKRPIVNQEDYIYSRKTMEGEDASPADDARVHAQLYEGFKQVLESNIPMSDALRQEVEKTMKNYKPPNV